MARMCRSATLYQALGVALGEHPPGHHGGEGGSAGRGGAGTARRHRRSLGAAARRPGAVHGLGLDAHPPARQAGGVELPLIISDHADWDDLLRTIQETQAPEIWVTHGAEEALIHAVSELQDPRAGALAGGLRGREE